MDCKKQLQSVQKTSSSEMKPQANDIVHERRSANYKPNIWNYDYLQSLSSIYDGQEYERRVQKLKEDVRIIFANAVDSVATFELIDSVNKLGLASHFDMEIKEALDTIASTKKKISKMLELLEASQLGLEGENILDVARDFSTATLKESISSLDSDLAKQVVHVLKLPSQRRVQWFDVKWHINSYEKDIRMNSSLLELAKLHFDIVQAIHQKDLRESSRWWRNLGLTKNLSFARDRLAESFMCSVGLAFEPEYTCFRKWLTKVIILILIIDDVYDVDGILEELKHFTNAVNRWDVSETQQLPECMKTCFLALYNTTNEIANEIQKEKGTWNQVLPHLKKGWTDFCNALFVEAKWYNMGYTPSLQEYLSNGWISSTAPLLLVHEFFSMGHEVTNGMEDFLEKNQEIAERARGDVPSSILCYMREADVSEEIAQKHIKDMINKSWEKINGQCFNQLPMLQSFVNIATNNARVAHSLYQYGDGFGVQDRDTWKNIVSLLWTDFCNALFVEAKWYNMGYTPSLQEYLSNGWISSTAPLLLVHEFFSMGHEVTNGMEDFLEKNQEIVERARGDVPSSILCYMREADVSEEIAQKHIKDMINKSWKKINGQCFNQLPMLQSFVNIATNNARVAHSLYQYGDGFGVQDRDTRKNIVSLLVEPLSCSTELKCQIMENGSICQL
ncbi:(E,E)-alpha-farnesene synthase [Quercus suber]|uniref:(E,E)-alpha-farnesene synthase n=1 Tax=Quercus suber TaxID=58331 RepID=A0AAW0KWJ1_QUESU